MTSFPVSVTDTVFTNEHNGVIGETNPFPFTYALGAGVTTGILMHDSNARQFRAGGLILQGLAMHDVSTQLARYKPIASDTVLIHQIIVRAYAVTLAQGLAVHPSAVAAYALQILQGLKIGATPAQLLKYKQTIATAIRFHDGLARFLGGNLTQGLAVHASVASTWQFVRQITQSFAIHPSFSRWVVYKIQLASGVNFTDAQILKMLYKGDHLLDTLVMSVAYADPGGGFTTWAINTRTGAVTEYANYVFNSMAKMGHHFLGADHTGLWRLDGELDGSLAVPTDIKSGLMNLGGSHFTSFKAIYLGIVVKDNAEDFILKIVAPGPPASSAVQIAVGPKPPGWPASEAWPPTQNNDRSYVYKFHPNDTQTSKVPLGKGLRSRYFSWELITAGADYDLDGIEFVPIITQRRI